ncbi:hypothetical protein A2U01_0088871, partial [Trifolium medium]|nr:hypothetical protein [Trifolium medium]
MEEEGMVQEGDEDTSVLYDYGAPHIARCVYDNF